MAKVCIECFEVFKPESLQKDEINNFQHCPKMSCTGEVIDVDELILPTIIELNRKEYFTKYCCAGHYYESSINSYIMFQEGITIPNLPNNYKYDEDSEYYRGFTIRNYFINDNSFEAITKNAMELYLWSLKLPINEDI